MRREEIHQPTAGLLQNGFRTFLGRLLQEKSPFYEVTTRSIAASSPPQSSEVLPAKRAGSNRPCGNQRKFLEVRQDFRGGDSEETFIPEDDSGLPQA
jgi:hypothetical protein